MQEQLLLITNQELCFTPLAACSAHLNHHSTLQCDFYFRYLLTSIYTTGKPKNGQQSQHNHEASSALCFLINTGKRGYRSFRSSIAIHTLNKNEVIGWTHNFNPTQKILWEKSVYSSRDTKTYYAYHNRTNNRTKSPRNSYFGCFFCDVKLNDSAEINRNTVD